MKRSYKHLRKLIAAHDTKRGAIRTRLKEFATIRPTQYFYELLYCCLTPQSSAANAVRAQMVLEQHDFLNRDFDPEPFLNRREHYIRFHKTKARRLLEMKENFSAIFSVVTNGRPATEKREWLVQNVKGLSYKEATHFLRNVGLNDDLAILDRHILKNLQKHGVITSLPKSMTRKRYLTIEKRFQRFARDVGVPINELDLLFWSNEAGKILK